MNNVKLAARAAEVAAHRRAHLCTRGILDGVIRGVAWVGTLASRARARLDPEGGAHAGDRRDRGAVT